jgi:hypothetical protein
MTDTRISIALMIALLTLALAAVLTIQPYSVRSPWSVYDTAGQRFLSAALRRDSAELTRLAVSSSAVDWAIRTQRDHPHALSVWAHFARAGAGVIRSDTSRVLFETATEVCPILITFVGHEAQARVLEAKPRCYSNRQDVF